MSQKGMDDLKTPLMTPLRRISPFFHSLPPRDPHTGVKQNGVSSAPAINPTSSTTPRTDFTAVPLDLDFWLQPPSTSLSESSKYVIPMRSPPLPHVHSYDGYYNIGNPQNQLHPDPTAVFASESRKFLSSRKGERSYPSGVEMEKESGRHRSGSFSASSNGAASPETYHYRRGRPPPIPERMRSFSRAQQQQLAHEMEKESGRHQNPHVGGVHEEGKPLASALSSLDPNLSPPPEQSPRPLEWIPQAKDPTPTKHPEQRPTFCSPAPKRTLGPLEWIPQAKDPTTASREVFQSTSPTSEQVGHRQTRSDADSTQVIPAVATRRLSIISWVCRMFHVRPRSVGVQQDRGSAVATIVTPTSSVTPCPSLSTVVVSSSEGHKCSSPSLFPPAVTLSQPPELSLGPVERVPQAKDPTAHFGEVGMDELGDATAKHVVPATWDPPTEPAFNELDHPSGSIDGDLVRDLTDLVKRGPRAYRGQYSDVYKGTCGRELVAIKVIKSLPSDPLHAVRRRMRREVGTASRFNHPNVLAVYGVVEGDWGQFGGIVTLWCPNGDACTYLHSAPLTPLARLLMVCGVASGLEYIHSLSVVHGDLKPGNILIDASGNPLICDFGLVCILDAEQPDRAADNTTTIHNGTVRYLSYELAQDPPEPRTGASDIHALGCVTYEFLYLEKPYSARIGNNAELYIFRDIAAGVPPALRPPMELSTSLASLWSLLESCWDQEPYRRPVISSFSNSLRLLTEGDLQHHLL